MSISSFMPEPMQFPALPHATRHTEEPAIYPHVQDRDNWRELPQWNDPRQSGLLSCRLLPAYTDTGFAPHYSRIMSYSVKVFSIHSIKIT